MGESAASVTVMVVYEAIARPYVRETGVEGARLSVNGVLLRLRRRCVDIEIVKVNRGWGKAP